MCRAGAKLELIGGARKSDSRCSQPNGWSRERRKAIEQSLKSDGVKQRIEISGERFKANKSRAREARSW
jgi:hypothetical protein